MGCGECTRLPSALSNILCGSQVRFLEGRQMETTGCGDGLVNCRPACALGGGVVVAWCEYGSETREKKKKTIEKKR